jgi:tetratricopeptide (TPR) repeat protein
MASEQSSNKIGKSVGEKIRAARVALKYTQSKLASPDFSVSYISAIERGQIHPSLRALEIIAGRLGLPSAQFLPQRPQLKEGQQQQIVQPEREDDEGDFVLLKAHQLLAQEKAQEALTTLGKVSAKRMKREQQLQHRYLTACAHLQLKHFQECEQFFTTLVELAKETNYAYIYLHALDMLGTTYAASENYGQALISHHHCLDLLREAGVRDPLFIFQVLMELGEDYTGNTSDDEARDMFVQAIEVTHEFETLPQVQRIYMTLASHYAAQNDLFVSTLYTYNAAFANEQMNREQQRSQLYYALGKTLVMQDSKSDEHNGSHTINSAYRTLIEMQEQEKHATPQDALFTHQRLPEALQCVREAIDLASPSDDTLILADALLLFGRIEYDRQQFESGDEHFAEGLAIMESLHLAEELADNAMYYAQQLEARGKEREALVYFRRAFQSGQNRYVGA